MDLYATLKVVLLLVVGHAACLFRGEEQRYPRKPQPRLVQSTGMLKASDKDGGADREGRKC